MKKGCYTESKNNAAKYQQASLLNSYQDFETKKYSNSNVKPKILK